MGTPPKLQEKHKHTHLADNNSRSVAQTSLSEQSEARLVFHVATPQMWGQIPFKFLVLGEGKTKLLLMVLRL